EEEAKIKEHEATHQKQIQQSQQVINQLKKQLKAKNQQVSTVVEYQIAEKQEQLDNLFRTTESKLSEQEKQTLRSLQTTDDASLAQQFLVKTLRQKFSKE